MKLRLTLFLLPILPFVLPPSAEAASAPDTVRSVLDRLGRTDGENIPFVLEGIILPRGQSYLFFTDKSGGTEVHGDFDALADLRRWDSVRISGKANRERNETFSLMVEKIEILGHNPAPPPASVSGSDVRNDAFLYRHVRVRGVVASVVPDDLDRLYCWINLRTSTGPVMVVVSGKRLFDFNTLNRLLDAEIEITGLVIPATGWRSPLGNWLTLSDDDRLDIVIPARENPFSAPAFTDPAQLHRQRVEGCVVAVRRDRYYLRTNAGRMVTVIPSAPAHMPESGDSVAAVGFAEPVLFNLQLTEALTRNTDLRNPHKDEPSSITGTQLFKQLGATPVINPVYNGKLVRLVGTVVNVTDSPTLGRLLLLNCDGLTVTIDLSAFDNKRFAMPEAGSSIAVTGLCLAEFEDTQASARFPRFRQFIIVPRQTGDVTLLSSPSWWTPFRLLVIILSLSALAVFSAIWNFLLKSKSERRGKELYEEKIGHALAEQKVEERTRLAVELHDSISQNLTGVALQLDGGEIETAKSMLSSCRAELRRCLWDLRSRTFEETDLTEAVTRTISPHLNGCEATVRFNVPRKLLSESLIHAILRIVRELVVNAIRHGQAQHLRIAGERHGDIISFSVRDDGCGFVPETAPGPKQGHFGLLGVRERIEAFNGILKIESSPGLGAKVTVTLSAKNDNNE